LSLIVADEREAAQAAVFLDRYTGAESNRVARRHWSDLSGRKPDSPIAQVTLKLSTLLVVCSRGNRRLQFLSSRLMRS
jgi:hypothetical protein